MEQYPKEDIKVNASECKHVWDKESGKFEKGIPHIGIKGKWVRNCLFCGYKQYYSSGMFTGWFSTP